MLNGVAAIGVKRVSVSVGSAYSVRKAMTGFARAARRAGSQAPTRAAARRSTATFPYVYVTGSPTPDTVSGLSGLLA
jgi:2-methylisocitrate lyase-like PEP mutase family enzyme